MHEYYIKFKIYEEALKILNELYEISIAVIYKLILFKFNLKIIFYY